MCIIKQFYYKIATFAMSTTRLAMAFFRKFGYDVYKWREYYNIALYLDTKRLYENESEGIYLWK